MTTTNDDDGLQPVIRTGDEQPQAFVQIRKPPQKTTWPWLVAGVVFIVMTSIVTGVGVDWQGGDNLGDAIGFGLGYSLLPGLLLGLGVYLVIYFAALRRSNRDNGGWYLAALVGAALLSGMALSVAAGQLEARPSTGRAVRAVLDTAYAEQATVRAHMDEELVKADPELFMPTTLKRRGGHARAVAELDRRRELMNEAIAANEAIGARARTSIAGAIRNPERRRRVMAEFDAGYAARQATVTALWKDQERLLDMNQEQLEFLQRVRWVAEGDNFMFYRQADLDVYAARQVEIDRLTAESARDLEQFDRQTEERRRQLDVELDRLR